MSKGKRMLTRWLMAFLLIVGIGLILFPILSSLYNQMTATKTIDTYERNLKKTSTKKKAALTEQMTAHNQRLENGEVAVNDPFAQSTEPHGETQEGVSIYDNLSDELGDVLGHVSIPKINVNLPIYSGTSDLQLKKGAGLIRGTSFPIGGQGTHSVISAHRGLPTADMFTDLPKLKTGDVFYIESFEQTLAYEVDQIKVVKPEDVEELQIKAGQDFLTLLTCTPYMLNTDRLLVRGKRIPYNAETKNKLINTQQRAKWWKVAAIFFLITSGLLLLYGIKKRKK